MESTTLEWGLAGKSVIVTGASSGIGAATASALGAAGASVLLVGRDEASPERAGGESGCGRGPRRCGDRRSRGFRSGRQPRRPRGGGVRLAARDRAYGESVRSPTARGYVDRVPRSPVEDERGRADDDDQARRAASGQGLIDRVRWIDHRDCRIPGLLRLYRDEGRRGMP